MPNQNLPQLISAGKKYRQTLEMDVFAAARIRMRYVYENFDEVVISWSGGKDSSSCLELAREAARETGKLPVRVFFLDEEVIFPETLDLCMHHVNDPEIRFDWVCIPSIYRNACSEKEPDFIPFDPLKRKLWTHEPPRFALWPCGVDENGLPKMTDWRIPPSVASRAMEVLYYDPKNPKKKIAKVLGLRTEESFIRFSGLMSSGSFITKPVKSMYIVRPIYDWKARDVWLAIKENGWVYNKAYEKLWRAGGSPVTTRVAPLFHAEAAMNLREVMLFWPKFWPLVRARVRGAQAVAINNGALHKIERWKGETWQDASTRYLNSLGSEKDREQMFDYVYRMIDRHSRHSMYPLQDTTECPECRMSWKKIARACARGDRQERMLQVNMSLKNPGFAKRKKENA